MTIQSLIDNAPLSLAEQYAKTDEKWTLCADYLDVSADDKGADDAVEALENKLAEMNSIAESQVTPSNFNPETMQYILFAHGQKYVYEFMSDLCKKATELVEAGNGFYTCIHSTNDKGRITVIPFRF